MAQATFFEQEGFRGRSFTTESQINNFERYGFNDRASSVVVERGRWEACEDANFRGRCVLLRRGSYKPLPGWGKFALQVIAASALLAVLLVWGAQYFDWVEMRGKSWQRIGLLAALMVAAAVLYFGALWAAGLKLRQMLRR